MSTRTKPTKTVEYHTEVVSETELQAALDHEAAQGWVLVAAVPREHTVSGIRPRAAAEQLWRLFFIKQG